MLMRHAWCKLRLRETPVNGPLPATQNWHIWPQVHTGVEGAGKEKVPGRPGPDCLTRTWKAHQVIV